MSNPISRPIHVVEARKRPVPEEVAPAAVPAPRARKKPAKPAVDAAVDEVDEGALSTFEAEGGAVRGD